MEPFVSHSYSSWLGGLNCAVSGATSGFKQRVKRGTVMFIASRGPESQVVLSPAAPPASPAKSAPTPGGASRVAHLDNERSSQSFGYLPVPTAVFEPQPPEQGQSLFHRQVQPRDVSLYPGIEDLAAFSTTDPRVLEFLKAAFHRNPRVRGLPGPPQKTAFQGEEVHRAIRCVRYATGPGQHTLSLPIRRPRLPRSSEKNG